MNKVSVLGCGALLSLVFVAACSGAPDDVGAGESASTSSGNTTIVFNDGEKPDLLGTIVPGAELTIVYSAAREQCHDAFGNPATTMFYRGDDGHVSHVPLRRVESGELRANITAPRGHLLAVWFHAQTVGGEENGSCDRWDSNLGQNFTFHIQ